MPPPITPGVYATTLKNQSAAQTAKFQADGTKNHKELVDAENAAADFSFGEMTRKLLVSLVSKAMGNATSNAKELIQVA